MQSFTHDTRPSRVVFGSGTIHRVADEVRALGRSRVLVLAGPHVLDAAGKAEQSLGPLAVARFDGAAMHTPVEVTEQALRVVRDHDVDCVVAIGGGSTTGLAKALAVRTGIDQVIVPTTYAGSEVTPVLGETEHGTKTTRSSPEILPEVVIYDVDLTLTMPVELTVTSAINAMAHAVEALYSAQSNPLVDAMALESIKSIARGLPTIADHPQDLEARADLLQATWLAGSCLGAVGMSLHHKLCHTLGGSFDLPHAPTHTVILPYAMAYNAPAVPDVMARIAEAMGVPDAPTAVFDLVHRLGGPTSLRALGMAESDLNAATEAAVSRPYANPREITRDGIRALLDDAWHGRRPDGPRAIPDLSWLTAAVVTSFEEAQDTRLKTLMQDLVRHAHHFVLANDVTEDEWKFAIDFLTRTGQMCSDTRQEFVLLSDTLGISSVVDYLTNSRSADATPSAVLGPFYVEGPPALASGSDISAGLPGLPMWVDARVVAPDGSPVPGATVDVWQSNQDGFYDVQLPDLEGPVLRARFTSDDAGRVRFWSIQPCEYPIPVDGPVGQMLTATGRHPYRAPHEHFMISAPGFRKLITQLFVAGGAYLDSDAVFGVKEALIVDFQRQTGPTPDGRRMDGQWSLLDFTFTLSPE